MKGRGLIVYDYNLGMNTVDQTLRFPALKIASANLCNGIEYDGERLGLPDSSVKSGQPARSLACARVIFTEGL